MLRITVIKAMLSMDSLNISLKLVFYFIMDILLIRNEKLFNGQYFIFK